MLKRWLVVTLAGTLAACGTHAEPPASTATATTRAERSTMAPEAKSNEARATSREGFTRGSLVAPVVVIEFTDFGCRYCGDFARNVFPSLDSQFVASGSVRWQLVPIATASTPHALEAAAAMACAAESGRAWEMHDRLFASQREWVRFGNPRQHFSRYARAIGIGDASFDTCYRDARTRSIVAGFRALAAQAGVRIAPTFLVSGRRIEGALALDDMREALRLAGAGS